MEHRIKELDYLKSIFILLMIVFHLVYISDKYPYIKQIVYTFHMSAFLIISGYLDNVQKDIRSFVRKLFWIFVPYMCMEAGYVIMSHILPVRESIPEVTPIILLHKIFIKPLGPYWYLHTLIICSLLHYLAFRYTHMKTISQLILLGLGLFATAYWGGLIVFISLQESLSNKVNYHSLKSFNPLF